MQNGKLHRVYQDAPGSSLVLSPETATICRDAAPQISAIWISTVDAVELRLNAPDGQALGQFKSSGYLDLPKLDDGTLVYLVQPANGTIPARVLASAEVHLRTGQCTDPAYANRGVVNAASFSPLSVAPGSLATVLGTGLSTGTVQSPGIPFPDSLGGVQVLLGGLRCPVSFVSPNQVNFLIPAEAKPGRYTLSIGRASGEVIVTNAAPGIFTLSGNGTRVPLVAASAVLSDGSVQQLSAYDCSTGKCSATPIALPDNLKELYLVLYGTGLRNAARSKHP